MATIKIPKMGESEVDIEPCRVCGSLALEYFNYTKETCQRRYGNEGDS
jgi:hypothetical protein